MKLFSQFSFHKIIIFIILIPFSIPPLLGQTEHSAQFSQIRAAVAQLRSIREQIERLETEHTRLDSQINILEAQPKLTWLEQRKRAKLTAHKDEINHEIISLYTKMEEHKADVYQLYQAYYPHLTTQLNTLLTRLETNSDSLAIQAEIEKLIRLRNQRSWLVSVQHLFVPPPEQLDTNLEQLVQFKQKLDANPRLRADIVSGLHRKINNLETMIAAAQREQELRHRLHQFSREMATLGGESQPEGDFNTRERTSTAITLPQEDSNYYNWEYLKTSSPAGVTQDLNPEDYLHLFDDISTSELNRSLQQLDTLRQNYARFLKQLQK